MIAQTSTTTEFLGGWLASSALQDLMTAGQNVLLAIVILTAGWIASKMGARTILRICERATVDTALSRFFSAGTRYLVLAATVISALGAVGIETTSVVAVMASAGFAVGLALQGSLSSFAAGVMILFFRPFQLGDVVTVAGETGAVEDIGLFATTLHTPDARKIILPNASITAGNIVNHSALGLRVGSIAWGIAYGEDLDLAQRVVSEAVAALPIVASDQGDVAQVFTDMAASSLNFDCRYPVQAADFIASQGQVRRAIHDALVAANIDIPFDQVVVHRAN